MRASITASAERTQRIIEGSLLARLLRPLVRAPRERHEVDLCPAAAAGLLETSPGPARTVRADDTREYWRRRAILADMMLRRCEDLATARRLQAIYHEAIRRVTV